MEQLGLMLWEKTEKEMVSEAVNVDVGDGVGVRVCEPEPVVVGLGDPVLVRV